MVDKRTYPVLAQATQPVSLVDVAHADQQPCGGFGTADLSLLVLRHLELFLRDQPFINKYFASKHPPNSPRDSHLESGRLKRSPAPCNRDVPSTERQEPR